MTVPLPLLLPVLCVLVALVACASCTPAVPGNWGVDRMYGDLAGMPLLNVTTPEACHAACSASPACVAWAFAFAGCPIPLTPAACWLKAELTAQSLNQCRVSGTKISTLYPLQLPLVPVGDVLPQGWLLGELRAEAGGLAGHVQLFWAGVQNSSWVGGDADVDLHERLPYFVNGVVPLAFQVNDTALLAYLHRVFDYIFAHQLPNGWIGPTDSLDAWSRMPMLLAMAQYAEGCATVLGDAAREAQVVDVMYKFVVGLHKILFGAPLDSWAAARYQDLVLSVQWLLDHHPRSESQQVLWDLMHLAKQQGFDWDAWFSGPNFPTKEVTSGFSLWTHGVNNAQAIKSSAVDSRLLSPNNVTGRQACVNNTIVRVARLDAYHGQANGMFTCDEHLAGRMPSHGTELCTVVEASFSFVISASIDGNATWLERAEHIVYNAFFATWTKEFWAHQYLQEVNEINSQHIDNHLWITDGPDSNIYGLVPNYYCCLCNGPSGLPKFTSNMVMHMGSGSGVLFAMYGPLTLNSSRLANGNVVSAQVETTYPFSPDVHISLHAEQPLEVGLRIPSWSTDTKVLPSASCVAATPEPQPGTVFLLKCGAGESWVNVSFTFEVRTVRRFNDAVSVYVGPLLFALPMGENYTVLRHYAYESNDYQIEPTARWRYAIDVDTLSFKTLRPVGSAPFTLAGAPVGVTARAVEIDWGIDKGVAAAPPSNPPASGKVVDVVLVPYGCTTLRIAEITTVSSTYRPIRN